MPAELSANAWRFEDGEGEAGSGSGPGSGRSRRRRAAPLPPGQIVAELSGASVGSGSVRFLVGDGGTYGGFANTPLHPEGRYKIYVVANSQVERLLFSVSDPLSVK